MHPRLTRVSLLTILATPGCSLWVDTSPYRGREETATQREPSSRANPEAGTRVGSVDAQVVEDDAGADPQSQGDASIVDAAVTDRLPDAMVDEVPPPPNQFMTLEKGDMSAVVVREDDLPLVFFHAAMLTELDDLGVIECRDAACTGSTARSLEVPGNAGTHVHARLDSAGLPIVSYNQAGFGGEAKFLRCRDKACTQADAWFFETGSVAGNIGLGEWSSIALTAEGFPLVSYFDRKAGDLRAALCHRSDCCEAGTRCQDSMQGPTLFTVAGESSEAGEFGAVEVGADGNPVFAYYNATKTALEFAHCADPGCTLPIEKRTLDDSADVGKYVALVIGADGFPLVFYYDATHGDLKRCKCLDAACKEREVGIVDGSGASDVGSYASAIVGSDGVPVIAYFDQTQGDLKVARCKNDDCSDAETHTVDGSESRVGLWPSIALRPSDGRPVISYQDWDTQRIRLVLCGTKSCGP